MHPDPDGPPPCPEPLPGCRVPVVDWNRRTSLFAAALPGYVQCRPRRESESDEE
ncbi:hypothetical protein GCM10023223_11550 [Stackebrandtia albiflava]